MEEKLEKIKNNGIEKLENAKTVEELQKRVRRSFKIYKYII